MATEPKHIRELRPLLAARGIKLTKVEHTKATHLRLHVAADGVEASFISALSPSTRGNHNMCLQNARRALREKREKHGS